MHRADILRRAVAAAIDLFAACLLLGIAGLAARFSPAIMPWDRRRAAVGAFCFLWLFYSSLEVPATASPGKILAGLRIGSQAGRDAGFGRLFLRWSTKNDWLVPAIINYFYPNSAFVILTGLMLLLTGVGLLGAFNDDRLSWHDQWAHTAVWVRRKRPNQITKKKLESTQVTGAKKSLHSAGHTLFK